MKRALGDLYRAADAAEHRTHKRSITELRQLNGTRGDVQCAPIIHYRAPATAGDKRHPLRCGYLNVNVCSGGTLPYKLLSPMLLGPIQFRELDATGTERLYTATNVENLWQFTKVWSSDLDAEGNIKQSWFALRDAGWADPKPHRRPRGKANTDGPNPNVPLFSYWGGLRLPYEVARKVIYIPFYVQMVEQTAAYKQLRQLVDNGTNVQIVGYDGRDFTSDHLSLKQCLDDATKPFGHELVLAALLRNERVWEQ